MMTEEVKGVLLNKVKRELKITWEDEDTNASLVEMIEDAEVALNHKLGGEIDYSLPGQERELFKNYCLYAFNQCLDEFDATYMNEIYQIRHKIEVQNEI